MAESNEELARQIADVSPLSFESALEALKTDDHTRELALSILESTAAYEQDLKAISEARQRLRALA